MTSPILTFESETILKHNVEISYIEPDEACPKNVSQYSDWIDIPNSHFDYIWFEYCPIFFDIEVGINILTCAINKLKNGGKIIIAISDDSKRAELENILETIGEKVSHKLVNYDDIIFHMKRDERNPRDSSYFIITKPGISIGGKTRTKKYTRRNIKRNRTRKYRKY
jgi:SAM-dependent methyltransferase